MTLINANIHLFIGSSGMQIETHKNIFHRFFFMNTNLLFAISFYYKQTIMDLRNRFDANDMLGMR